MIVCKSEHYYFVHILLLLSSHLVGPGKVPAHKKVKIINNEKTKILTYFYRTPSYSRSNFLLKQAQLRAEADRLGCLSSIDI